MYSLGVILIDVGLWQTVDKIYRDCVRESEHRRSRPPTLASFQKYLRSSCVKALGFRVGKVYMDAVKFCLSDNVCDGDANTVSEEVLLDLFNQQVVSELAKCIA
jgi:hypothetical protein